MKALIIVDMLNDFVTGSLKCDRAQRIIPHIRELIDGFHKQKLPVIFANDSHLDTDFEMHRWGAHAIEGTEGAEVIPELKPHDDDIIVGKHVYSSFFETPLDSILRSRNIKEVVLTGLHTHLCVRHTAADAFFRGYKIIIPEDGVDSFTVEDHESGLAYLKEYYGATISDASSILKKLPK
ncbi:MAG: cysteine hydrolase family protein [Candidatus Odinarchaeota archaeon]